MYQANISTCAVLSSARVLLVVSCALLLINTGSSSNPNGQNPLTSCRLRDRNSSRTSPQNGGGDKCGNQYQFRTDCALKYNDEAAVKLFQDSREGTMHRVMTLPPLFCPPETTGHSGRHTGDRGRCGAPSVRGYRRCGQR